MKYLVALWCGMACLASPSGWAADDTVPLLKIINSQVSYQIHADGSYTKTEDQVIEPLTREGVDVVASESLGFSRQREKYTDIQAYTLKPDGRKLMVPENKIFTQEDPAAQGAPQYSDYQYRAFSYPDVEVGDKVVLHSVLQVSEGTFKGYFTEVESINPSVVVDHAEVSVQESTSLNPLLLEVRDWKADKIVIKDQQRHYRWTYEQPQARQIHGDMYVSTIDYAPLIVMSSFQDWSQLAHAYEEGAADKAQPTAPIIALANKLTEKVIDPQDKARILYDWVRMNIRYVGIWLGNGGVVPHKAEDILHNRYGDCKDKATLLQSLLAAVNIPSEQVLINMGTSYFRSDVPNTVSFNHAILYVPQLKTYLDATAELIPFGALPFEDTGKPVLLEGGKLATTPLTTPQSDALQITSHLTLNENGQWAGNTEIDASGAFNLELRSMVVNIDPYREDQFIKQHLQFGLQRGSGQLMKSDPYALQDVYSIKTQYTLSNRLSLSHYGAFPVPAGFSAPTNLVDFLYLTEAPLRSIARVCYPLSITESTSIQIPSVLKIEYLPENQDVVRGRFRYQAHYEQRGDIIQVTRTIKDAGRSGVCTPAEVGDLHQIAQILSQDLNAQIGYKPDR